MRYEGSIYRPPSEAYSLIIQVTIGCAHNNCTFCGMFKDKQFRVREVEEVLRDIETARRAYQNVGKIFLADGDAFVLTNEKLMVILNKIKQQFPECERVGIYATPQDVNKKTISELEELRDAGIGIIYIGAESGNEETLRDIQKGATRAEIVSAIKKIEASGIKSSVTFISGLAGRDNWKKHAIDSGTMISETEPSYVGLLTLMVEQNAPLYADVLSGKFKKLSPEEVVAETALLLENINVHKTCVFRSNHASNYVSLRGNLPNDKEKMLGQLHAAMENKGMLKDERFRAL